MTYRLVTWVELFHNRCGRCDRALALTRVFENGVLKPQYDLFDCECGMIYTGGYFHDILEEPWT